MTSSELRQQFEKYRELKKNCDFLSEDIDELQQQIESARIASYSLSRSAPQAEHHKNDILLVRLETLSQRLVQAQNEAISHLGKIENAICCVSNMKHWAEAQKILRMKYIECKTVSEIAEILFGDLKKFWECPESYTRRTNRTTKRAIEEIVSKLKDNFFDER